MSGLSIGVGGGMSSFLGGTRPTGPASWGSAESYGAGVTSGAFGDTLTGNQAHPLDPRGSTGLFFFIGVASIVVLVALRASLPN